MYIILFFKRNLFKVCSLIVFFKKNKTQNIERIWRYWTRKWWFLINSLRKLSKLITMAVFLESKILFGRVVKGLFGFLISIIHNSVFITHNSKMVGSMMETSYEACLDFNNSIFSFYFHYSILWFLSDELWKLITHFNCFQFP